MKVGLRKTSVKKMIAARTSAKLTRSIKKALIPGYGTKNSMLKKIHPIKSYQKKLYNRAYRKLTFSFTDLFKSKK